ncbi:MAG: LytR C-terminal domain-containing protein [Gemmatimonadaceae bacterium]
MKIGRWIVLAVAVMAAVIFGFEYYKGSHIFEREEPAAPQAITQLVPPDVRIKVQVLNATRTRGLARRATTFLRDRGFDVVAVGTAQQQRDATLVLDRSNHPAWAALVGKAFGARVESRIDSLGYLDVTVLVGADWRPPPLPFYP